METWLIIYAIGFFLSLIFFSRSAGDLYREKRKDYIGYGLGALIASLLFPIAWILVFVFFIVGKEK